MSQAENAGSILVIRSRANAGLDKVGGDIPRIETAVGTMGSRLRLRDDGDMELIESLTAQGLAAILGALTASPLLVVAGLVLALVLYSGLAARIVEAVEARSGSFDRVRRVATNRLRAVATGRTRR